MFRSVLQYSSCWTSQLWLLWITLDFLLVFRWVLQLKFCIVACQVKSGVAGQWSLICVWSSWLNINSVYQGKEIIDLKVMPLQNESSTWHRFQSYQIFWEVVIWKSWMCRRRWFRTLPQNSPVTPFAASGLHPVPDCFDLSVLCTECFISTAAN